MYKTGPEAVAFAKSLKPKVAGAAGVAAQSGGNELVFEDVAARIDLDGPRADGIGRGFGELADH